MAAGNPDDLEQVAQGGRVRVEEVVVREVRLLAQYEQRGKAHRGEGRRRRGHLAVRGNDRGLAVAVAPEPVVRRCEMIAELRLEQLARGPVQLALVVPALDRLLERGVGALS